MAAKARLTAAVSTRALVQRINRKLAEAGRVLKKSRGARLIQDVGDWYVLDVNHNAIVAQRVNVESLGRKLECLAKWEHLEGKD